jgi:acetylornithine/N-succinyldiaminopimelate aminotransferase
MEENIYSLENNYHLQIYDRYPIVLVKGEGVHVWDDKGNEYIDALAGIAVNSLGHCHPNVVSAIQLQASQLIHVSNLFYNLPQSKLAFELTRLSGMDKVFFCNSGVEAVEGALKIARKYAQINEKKGIILSMENGFHGRSITTLALGKKKYQEGFGPMTEGFCQVPFNDIESFRKALNKKIIAVILEAVQGEGGINVTDDKYLKEVKQICDDNDILLIMDEIQCGIGRTGKMFAFQQYDIIPDIITLAKGLGSGFPVGAVLVTNKLKDVLKFGDHGTTFGGNPLACAVALTTLETITKEGLLTHVEKMGKYLHQELTNLQNQYKCIIDVRGMGLMVGLELKIDAKEIVKKMITKGVLANCTSDRIIRLVPPLIIEKYDIDIVINTLSEELDEAK